MVKAEYNNSDLNQSAIKLTSKTPNTAKNVIYSKREIPINKDIPIETKSNDDTLKGENDVIPPNDRRDTIPLNNTTNDNSNDNIAKMHSGMPFDDTKGPALKYGQLESEIFAKNIDANHHVVAYPLM